MKSGAYKCTLVYMKSISRLQAETQASLCLVKIMDLEIEFIVDKHIWDISKGLFSIRTCGIDSVVWFCLFDLILYVPSTIFQLYRDGSSWVEPVLS